MKITHIFLDMDNVLVNFSRGLANDFGVDESLLACWEVWGPLGITEGEFWDWLHGRDAAWWAALRPFPWAKQLYAFCQSLAPTTLLTQPSSSPLSHAGKKMWIDQHLPGAKYLMGNVKDVVSREGCVLIDDTDKNIGEWRRCGGVGITFPRPWNKQSVKTSMAMAHVCSQLGALAGHVEDDWNIKILCKQMGDRRITMDAADVEIEYSRGEPIDFGPRWFEPASYKNYLPRPVEMSLTVRGCSQSTVAA